MTRIWFATTDLDGNYALNPNFDVQAGYSWFWNGT